MDTVSLSSRIDRSSRKAQVFYLKALFAFADECRSWQAMDGQKTGAPQAEISRERKTSGGPPTSNGKTRKFERLRRKYEALLEGAPDAVFVADAESGEIIEANEAAANLLETTVEEITGRHQSGLHPPEKPEKYKALFDRHQNAAGESGEATLSKLEDGSQICVVTDTGKKIPVEINASFVDLDGEELFVGIFRNISDRLRREEALREAKEAAEKASDLKSAILRNMSHEVRTPITAIIGYSKILADSLEGTPQEQADKIHEASQHLMKTIDSVLELSKLEADASDLDREIARLDQAVEWALDPLYRQAERHDLELQTVIPDQPIEGYWNQEALYKIVLQLVENAIKFTPAGGRIEIRVREEQNEGVLEVEDTGIGMDAGEVESLFDPFRQASAGLTREHEGVGLGLTIVREITEALGGTIDVDTETGEGARVTVRLPQNKKM